MNFAEEIKSSVSLRSVCEHYGLSFNRSDFAICPFHNEKTPSFKAYPNKWHCFGCGEGGTVIDFVMKIENCNFDAACRKLDAAYNLGLYVHHNFAERRALEREAAARRKAQAEKAAAEEYSACQQNILSVYYRWLNTQPQTPAVIADLEYLDRIFDANSPISFDASARVNALLEKHPNRGDYDKQYDTYDGVERF